MAEVEVHKTPAGMITTEPVDQAFEKEKTLYTSFRALWLMLGIIETLLFFRFFLKLFGANPGNIFTGLIYTLSFIFYWPFQTMFGDAHLMGDSYLEWPIFIAIPAYLIFTYILINALGFGKPTNVKKVEKTISDNQL